MGLDPRLGEFTIQAPCPMDWDCMPGDERRRFCDACDKHVYDLSMMRPDELARLTSRSLDAGDELCGRIAVPGDAQDIGSKAQPAARSAGAGQFTIRWLMMVIAACAAQLGIVKFWILSTTSDPPKPPATKRSTMLLGKISTRSCNETTPSSQW